MGRFKKILHDSMVLLQEGLHLLDQVLRLRPGALVVRLEALVLVFQVGEQASFVEMVAAVVALLVDL